jgi:hypothetical protein
MRKILLAFVFALLPLTAQAQQNGGASNVSIGPPTGNCNSTQINVDSASGFEYTCKITAGVGTWFNQAGVAGSIAFPATVSGTVTSGGIPFFNSTTQMSSSAVLASGGVVLGGGAGVAPSTSTQLTFAAPTLTVGLAGTSSGVLALTGSTSGSATFTAPAVAGTITNAVISSNALTVNSTLQSNGTIQAGASSAILLIGRAGIRSPANGVLAPGDNAGTNFFQMKMIGVPTCAVTGAGATGTCALGTGSQDSVSLITITPSGAGIAATGTVTLTYNATTAFSAGHQADPVCLLWNGTGTWNARASLIGTTHSQTAPVLTWDNNAVALTAASTYQLTCVAFGI